MGKALLFFLAAFTIMGAYYTLDGRRGMQATNQRLGVHQHEVLARNAAQAGYQAARAALAREFSARTIEGTYENGTYTATLVVNGARAQITSEGRMPRGDGEPVTAVIAAEVQKISEATVAKEAPPFMQYALLSQGNLSLNGNLLGDILVEGDQRTTLNANMHTNGSLHVDGNSVLVKGFGTHVGTGTGNPSKALQNAFRPNYNPTGGAGAHAATAVAIPAYDAALYTSRVAVDRTTSGDLNLAGSYALGGTRENPFVWHVTGNLWVTGDTRLDGYVLLLVDGGVTFSGNVQAGTTGYNGPDESSLAFYVGGNVEFGGNTSIYGQVYTGGAAVFLSGTPHIYGSVTTRGSADLRGTPKIYYRRASPALTTIWQDARTERLQLLAYSER